MDDLFYYLTFVLIVTKIVGAAAVVASGLVGFLRSSSREKHQGQERMSVLNHVAFNSFSFVIGFVLLQLLYSGTVSTIILLVACSVTEMLVIPVNYFYRKRVPTPDQFETRNRYLPNASAQAIIEEAEFRSQNQPQNGSTTQPK